MFAPLQLFDNFIIPYHIGHVLIGLFGLSVLGMVPLRSLKLLSLNFVAFGVLFVMTPDMLIKTGTFMYQLLGIGLLVLAPVLYTAAKR